MNAEIEPEPAERIVNVRRIAGQKPPTATKRRRDALMYVVEISVGDGIRATLWKESLQPGLHRRVFQCLLVSLLDARREQHTPKPAPVVTADLEQRAPLVRIGE